VKCIVIGLSALAVFAGASACSGRSTPAPAHTESALSQKSYKGGETVGEDSATHGTLAEDRANCADTATEQMPAGDIESRWVDGCVAGTFLGVIGAAPNQSTGAGS
jgi:hypothetical protein